MKLEDSQGRSLSLNVLLVLRFDCNFTIYRLRRWFTMMYMRFVNLNSIFGFQSSFWISFSFANLIGFGFGLEIRIAVSTKGLVDPGEARGVIEKEGSVVIVVEFGAAIVREVVEDVEREVVAAVGDDGVELAKLNPNVESEEMRAHDDWGCESGGAKDDNLGPVGIGGRKTKGCLELVMDFVNFLVEPRNVQPAMTPVLEPILTYEEEAHLPGKLPPRRPRTFVPETQQIKDWPTRYDHWDDDYHIIEQNIQYARHIIHHRVQFRLLNFIVLQPSILLHYDKDRA